MLLEIYPLLYMYNLLLLLIIICDEPSQFRESLSFFLHQLLMLVEHISACYGLVHRLQQVERPVNVHAKQHRSHHQQVHVSVVDYVPAISCGWLVVVNVLQQAAWEYDQSHVNPAEHHARDHWDGKPSCLNDSMSTLGNVVSR